MSLGLGYAVSSLIFLVSFCVLRTGRLDTVSPALYWPSWSPPLRGHNHVDYLDRTLAWATFARRFCSFRCLHPTRLANGDGTDQSRTLTNRGDEIFYWVTILVSNTLGTAWGFRATDTGLGFEPRPWSSPACSPQLQPPTSSQTFQSTLFWPPITHAPLWRTSATH